MLPIVQDAVSHDRKLKFWYRKENERVERIVDPLGLVAKGSAWYLVAQTPRGFRTYRVSRIEEARLLEQPCERPANFDLPSYWETSTAQFRDRPRYKATLRLEPRTAERLKAWGCFSDPNAAEDADGWITLRAHFNDEDDACFIVMGLGPRVDVVGPATLRERVASDIDALARRAHTRTK